MTAQQALIVAGDQQVGIAGQLLPTLLQVQILDNQQQPLPGGQVGFSVSQAGGGAAPHVEFDADPSLGVMTTDAQGMVWVSARPDITTTGAIEMRAAVAGAPQIAAVFRATVYKPAIVADPGNSTGPFPYGNQFYLVFYYDGDGNIGTVDFSATIARPVRIGVQATNAEVRDPVILLHNNQSQFSVYLIPKTRSQPITLTLTDLDDPTVKLVRTLTVQTAPDCSRLTSYVPTTSSQDLSVQLEVVSGLDPHSGSPQRGYPGLTLSEPFQVKLRDAAGTLVYDTAVTSSWQNCTPPTTAPLSVAWQATGGFISTTKSKGTTAALNVPIGQAVYFTPDGPGPWSLRVGINTQVLDPGRQQFSWVDATGQPHCYCQFAIGPGCWRDFFIQLPALQLQEAASAKAATSLSAGKSYQVVVDCSAYVPGGTPDQLQLRGILRDGNDPPSYTGLSAPFKQQITMSQGVSPQVKSQTFVVIRGDPSGVTGLAQSIIPSAWLELSCAGMVAWLPTLPQARHRRVIAGTPSLQETEAATTPHDGFDESIFLCSGEMTRAVADLTFATRGGDLAIVRHYRDHLDGAGAAGPGWFCSFETAIDASARFGLRYLDAHGRVFDFVGATPPATFYSDFNTYATIDSDHGAFELVDRHGTRTDFNVDGTLRHIEDLNKNRTKFRYNLTGQLAEIEDPLGRVTKLSYYPDNTTPPELVGRLQTITGFDGRLVDYGYFTSDSSDGRKGWLQTVQRPAAPTMIGGQEQAGYRRSESYTYYNLAGDARDAALHAVIDSEQVTQCSVTYHPERRVDAQLYGGKSLSLIYDPTKPQVTVTDRMGNVRVWSFAVSPYADAATPTEVTEKANGVRPGGSDATTKMTHNRCGEMTSCQYPDGRSRAWVYDDGSVYQRSRGNLLSCTETNASGESRTTTWSYDQRFNYVARQSYWDGHALGIPRYLRVNYTYDGQGNLTDVSGPRTLFALLTKDAATGNDEMVWVHDQHRYHLDYNTFGLATALRYPNGITAAFEYYDAQAPAGSLGAGTSSNGGGFLGKITRDASSNATRDIYFPNVALAQLPTTLTFTACGDVQTWTDASGARTRAEYNGLRQITRVIEGDHLPSGPPQRIRHYRYLSSGVVARFELEQPTATPQAGGTLLSTDVTPDADGLPTRVRGDWEAAAGTGAAKSRYTRADVNADGLIEAVYVPDLAAPSTQSSTVTRDQLGLPYQQTLSPSSLPLISEFDYGNGGVPKDLVEPAGLGLTYGVDNWNAVDSLTDNASTAMQIGPDFSHRSGRWAVSGTTGGSTVLYGFQDRRYNELGMLRRCHDAVMAVDVAGGSFPIADPCEAYPVSPAGWPALGASTLDDRGQWCRGDGRSSVESLFDPLGNMVRFVNDENRGLYIAYDPLGGIARAIDGGSYEIRHKPDANGAVTEIEVDEYSTDALRPNGRTLRWRTRRDSLGRVQEVSDALGNTLRAEYDDAGQIQAVTDSIGPDSTNSSDDYNGHHINKAGNRTTYPRDGLGWNRGYEISMTQGGVGGASPDPNPWNLDQKTSRYFAHDAAGRLVTVTDHAGKVTTWNYDDAHGGRCTSVAYPASVAAAAPTTQFKYDGQGKLETSTDPNGTVLHYYYDDRNRLQKIVTDAVGSGVHASVGDGVQYSYDALDRLRTASQLNGQYPIELHFDFAGNLREESQQGLWIKCQFDGTGRRTQLAYPPSPSAGPVVIGTYDGNGRLRKLSAASGTLATYEYIGPTTVLNRATGPLTVQHGFDDAGRLNAIWLDSNKFRYDVQRRRDGRIQVSTRTTQTAGSPLTESRTYSYDSACRVVEEQIVFAAGRTPQQRDTTLGLDGDGCAWDRSVTETTAGTPVTVSHDQRFEARGRMIKRDQTPITYDANGNLINDGRQAYFYDFLDRLSEVKNLTTGDETHYAYDPLGRCVGRSRAGQAESYIYDGWHLIEVRVNNQVTERYYWGRGHNELVAAEINQKMRYFVTSPSGSIDSIFDDQGNLIESYEYSLQGEVTVLDGNRQVVAAVPQSRFLFHGCMYDPVTGLLDVRYRQFQTAFGQFLSSDPLGLPGFGNLYGWPHGDPINLTDRFGCQEDSLDWGEAAWSFGKTLGIGLVIVAGAAILVGTGLVAAPIVVIGGLAILGTALLTHTWMRQMDDQTIPQALFGGAFDTLGITSAWMGATGDDLATGAHYQLTGSQRGRLLGGGLGTIATFLLGGRAFRSMAGRAYGWRIPAYVNRVNYRFGAAPVEARAASAMTIVKAPNKVYAMRWKSAESPATGEVLGDDVGVRQPKTMDDFVDVIQARLRSKPGPNAPFRECAITRAARYNDAGQKMSSDLVYQTPALLESEIPAEVEEPVFESLEELVARYPKLKISGRMHLHPPSTFKSMPGHSWGDINVLSARFGANSAMGQSLAPGFQPFVARIGPAGAPEEFCYILMRPDVPAPAGCGFIPMSAGVPRALQSSLGGVPVGPDLLQYRPRRRH